MKIRIAIWLGLMTVITYIGLTAPVPVRAFDGGPIPMCDPSIPQPDYKHGKCQIAQPDKHLRRN